MAEEEELRLVVTLDDQASAALGQLRNQLEVLGRSNVTAKQNENITALKRGAKEAGQEIGGLMRSMQGLSIASEAANVTLRSFAGLLGAGGVGGGLIGAIGLVDFGISKFATSVIKLSDAARMAGVSTGQLKVLTDQMEKFGYSTEEAESTASNFFNTINNALRPGSAEFQRIISEAIDPDFVFNQIQLIQNDIQSGKSAGGMERAIKALQERYKDIVDQGLAQGRDTRGEAARQVQAFAANLGLTLKAMDIRKLVEATPKEIADWERRDAQMRKFNENWKSMVQVGQEFLAIIAEELAPEFDKLNVLIGHTGHTWEETIREQVRATIRDIKQAYEEIKAIYDFLKANEADVVNRLNRQHGPDAPQSGAEWLNDYIFGKRDFLGRPTQGGTPQRFMMGTAANGAYSPHTGGLEDGGIMSNSPMSQNIEDRRLLDENTEETAKTTNELKRLNDTLELGQLRTQMGGLQPGLGASGGLATQLGLGDIGSAPASIPGSTPGTNTGGTPGTSGGGFSTSVAAPAGTAPLGADAQSGKGSWYSQYQGQHSWVDKGDKPGSAALQGTPDWAQGIALPSRRTLGQWFDVQGPDGKIHRVQQTDLGPAKWTGRGIDISAAAAERMGYTPKNFPTNASWSWRPASAPESVANLGSPQQQAIAYAKQGQLMQVQPGGGAQFFAGSGQPVKTMTEGMAPAGSPVGRGAPGGISTITTASGRQIRVASDYAANFQGFLRDYEAAGGVAGPNTGGLAGRAGNASYHPRGMAIDLNQIGYGIRGGGRTLPQAQEDALAAKWGLFPGSQFSSRSDIGHFEVRNRAAALEAQRRNLGPNGATPVVIQGATTEGQRALVDANVAAAKAVAAAGDPGGSGGRVWPSQLVREAEVQRQKQEDQAAKERRGAAQQSEQEQLEARIRRAEHRGARTTPRTPGVGGEAAPIGGAPRPGADVPIPRRDPRTGRPTGYSRNRPGIDVENVGLPGGGPPKYSQAEQLERDRQRLQELKDEREKDSARELMRERTRAMQGDVDEIDKDSRQSVDVNGNGELKVDVNAPPRTNVEARGGGIFRKVTMRRQQQMTPAASGPSEPGSAGANNHEE